jgi:hypothetical protein
MINGLEAVGSANAVGGADHGADRVRQRYGVTLKSYGKSDAAGKGQDCGLGAGLGPGNGGFEVRREPLIATEPGETSLHHPEPWIGHELGLARLLAHNADYDAGGAARMLCGISGISDGTLDEQDAVPRALQQILHSAIAILHQGGVPLRHQRP